LRGTVKVGGWSTAPIPWPLAAGSGGFIFCGDLLKAIRQESVIAVAHWFGVSRHTVTQWRGQLEVPRSTPGTRKLLRTIALERYTPAWSRKMIALARTPQARAKLSRAKKGKPMHPRIRKIFLAAAKRPKSERFKRIMHLKAIQRARSGRVPFVKPEQVWTPGEIRMLGRRPDRDVATALGRSRMAVKLKRQRLGIVRFAEVNWTPQQIKLLGTIPDAELAARFGRTQASVEYMRVKLRRPYIASASRPWTRSELRLLGKYSDAKIARITRRTEKAVQTKRVKIRVILRPIRVWKPEDIKLLGQLPDAEVARRTGRTLVSVQQKRRLLKRSSVQSGF
jgi:hypothetical protein